MCERGQTEANLSKLAEVAARKECAINSAALFTQELAITAAENIIVAVLGKKSDGVMASLLLGEEGRR